MLEDVCSINRGPSSSGDIQKFHEHNNFSFFNLAGLGLSCGIQDL